MSAIRRWASGLLRAVLRHTPSDSQDWANAMLRELDVIDGDWAALSWALGCTTALFRHCVPLGLRAWLGKRLDGKDAVGVASGIVIAVAVTGSAFGLVRKLFYLFPAWDLGPMPWWVAMIGIPEVIFIVTAVALWRKRRSMAVGILLSAVTLVAHFIVHVATHGNGQ